MPDNAQQDAVDGAPAAAPLSLDDIGQIAVNVEDLPRATAFYRDGLGMPLLFQAAGMAFFRCGGVRLMLSVPESAEFAQRSSILYFRVADVESAHRQLAARGVEFIRPPQLVHRSEASELWMAFFRDSERNTLAIMGERPCG